MLKMEHMPYETTYRIYLDMLFHSHRVASERYIFKELDANVSDILKENNTILKPLSNANIYM